MDRFTESNSNPDSDLFGFGKSNTALTVYVPSPVMSTKGILFYGRSCVHMLKICVRDVLQTTCGDFIKFTPDVRLGTKIDWLDF